jgi:hypothetical protein
MFTWNENDMSKIVEKDNNVKDEHTNSLWGKMSLGLQYIKEDKPLLAVGTIESCFKISLVLFMFVWTPLLEGVAHTYIHPGSVFVCFMLARLVGSDLFQGIKQTLKTNSYMLSIMITSTGTLSFFFEYYIPNFMIIFIMLIYFDGLSGILFPLVSSLKSQMIPEKLRTTIMTFFRMPINVCCILTLCFSSYITTYQICLICTLFMLISTIINILLYMYYAPPDAEKKNRIVTRTSMLKKRNTATVSELDKLAEIVPEKNDDDDDSEIHRDESA